MDHPEDAQDDNDTQTVKASEIRKKVAEDATDNAVNTIKAIFLPEDSRSDDVAKSEVKNRIDGDLRERILESIEKAQRRSAAKAGRPVGLVGGGDESPKVIKGAEKFWGVRDMTKSQRHTIGEGRLMASAMLFAAKDAEEKGDIRWNRVRDRAKNAGHDHVADTIDKNLEAGDFSSGGSLIPDEMANDLVTFLFANTVVRQLGARSVEMPNGTLDFGKINTAVSASWAGETGTIQATDLNTGQVKLDAKKLKIHVILSNDVIRQSPRGMDTIVRDQMQSAASLSEDNAFIRGSGTSNQPKGIEGWTRDGNKFDRKQGGTTSTIEEITQDVIAAISTVAQGNHNLDQGSPGWIMPSTVYWGLHAALDNEGRPSHISSMLQNGDSLYSFPVRHTTNIPADLGNSNDEGKVYFGDFSKAVIGETLDMRMDETQEATITDESGNSVDLFDEDQRAMRLIHETDFALLYDDAFSIIEKVDWGADFGRTI